MIATFGERRGFTVRGSCLPNTTAFWIAECENVITLEGGSSQERYFECTPSWTTGSKEGVVKDQSGGNILHSFNVNVQAPYTPSPSIEPGASCGTGSVYDCALNCVSEANATDYQGDGECDNGEYDIVLTCPAFNNDGGDCDIPPSDNGCPSGEVPDCIGNCISESDALAWQSDEYCDDGTYGAVLTCSAFNNDGGACDSSPASTPSGCGTGEVEDCDGGCTSASWLGDGECDITLACSALNNDDGDCDSSSSGTCTPAVYSVSPREVIFEQTTTFTITNVLHFYCLNQNSQNFRINRIITPIIRILSKFGGISKVGWVERE